MFSPIPKKDIEAWTDQIDPLLERMAERSGGRFTAEDLYAGLASGLTWLAEIGDWRAAMVVKPINWPTGLNELEIVGLAGDGLPDWQEAMFSAERIARELHFDRLSIPHGRRGWVKPCLAHGWRQAGVIMEKDLFNG